MPTKTRNNIQASCCDMTFVVQGARENIWRILQSELHAAKGNRFIVRFIYDQICVVGIFNDLLQSLEEASKELFGPCEGVHMVSMTAGELLERIA